MEDWPFSSLGNKPLRKESSLVMASTVDRLSLAFTTYWSMVLLLFMVRLKV